MKIIVGVTGASGVIMSLTLLEALKEQGHEVHLVLSKSAYLTWELETTVPISDLLGLADYVYDYQDMGALISSGSFETDGMIVLPCSMKTLAGIVTGYADNLILRAADVCLKENRKVVIVPREMPLGKIHLRNLSDAANLGCTIILPMLTFYNKPYSLRDQIHHVIGKVLLQFQIKTKHFHPWGK